MEHVSRCEVKFDIVWFTKYLGDRDPSCIFYTRFSLCLFVLFVSEIKNWLKQNHHKMMYNLRNKEEYIKHGENICQRTIQFSSLKKYHPLNLLPSGYVKFCSWTKIPYFNFSQYQLYCWYFLWFRRQNNAHSYLKFWPSLLCHVVLYFVFLRIWVLLAYTYLSFVY